MHHGITRDVAQKASRRASMVRKGSANSINLVDELVENYKEDIEAQKQRLYELEFQELERLAGEQREAQELFYNHGKKASFF